MPGGLFAYGGQGDTWNGLALSDLNMNGFSITNINTVQVLQTAVTGQALEVYRNLAAASTDSPIVCFANQNAGDDQSVLTVTSAANAAASNPMVSFETTNAAFDQAVLSITSVGIGYGLRIVTGVDAAAAVPLVHFQATDAAYDQEILKIRQDGVGRGIFVDQNGNNYGLEIDSEATDNDGIYIAVGLGVVCQLGNPIGANATYRFWRNLAAADTVSPVMKVNQTHVGDDQTALFIQQDGDGPCLIFSQSKDVEIMDFDSCTDGGTTRTVIVESLKVQMPGGTTGYINLYNAE